jgi:hypothetical protein
MDGVLADFGGAYREIHRRLFETASGPAPGEPEQEEVRQAAAQPDGERDGTPPPGFHELRRRQDAVWEVIENTSDFWTTLAPLDPAAVRRIHELMLRHRWEVFFITQRPATAGDTVQRQTQRWLVEQGFDLPSVLVIGGSRGAAIRALRLNYHVDDNAQNCLDIVSESRARPVLVTPESTDNSITNARKLGIGVAQTVGQALDILEEATLAQTNPGLLRRLATLVGWK